MDTRDWPNTDHLSKLTEAKVEFIEKRANEVYDFVVASREILIREAHATLQWLFAIIIGAAGYLLSLFAKQYDEHPLAATKFWWVIVPLSLALPVAAWEARHLLYYGLMTTPIRPKGNSAQNIVHGGLLDRTAVQMRFLEAWRVDEDVQKATHRNAQIGTVINRARKAVILIPAFTLLGVAPLALMTWSGVEPWISVPIDLVLQACAGVAVWALRMSPSAKEPGSASGCPPPDPAAV